MKIIHPSFIPLGLGGNSLPISDTESSNAFGQLLRSMEQALWDQPSPGLRAGQPAPSQGQHTHLPAAALLVEEAAAPSLSDSVALKTSAVQSPSSPIQNRRTATTARTAMLDTHSNKPAMASNAVPRPEIAVRDPGIVGGALSSHKRDTAGTQAAPPSKSLPTKQGSASDTPFRVTVANTPSGLALVLRTHPSIEDDLESVEAQARFALQRYGLRAAKLLINGAPHLLTDSENTTHGN